MRRTCASWHCFCYGRGVSVIVFSTVNSTDHVGFAEASRCPMSSAVIVDDGSITVVVTSGRGSDLCAQTAADARTSGRFLRYCRRHGVCDCDRGGQLRLPHRLWCVAVTECSVRGRTDTTRKEYLRSIQTKLDAHGGLPWKPSPRQARRHDQSVGL